MAAVKELLRAENDGTLNVQFTLELEPESEYEVFIGGESAGRMHTNLSGKLSVSVELAADQNVQVKVVKC